uniref:Uncharacterized protein n=1 Tax=Arundo donax TaxID=35708 RepID=A0A0A9TZL5_ARUDO
MTTARKKAAGYLIIISHVCMTAIPLILDVRFLITRVTRQFQQPNK